MGDHVLPFATLAVRQASGTADERPIFFLHIPKTAGTSMRRSLQAALGNAQIYPSDDDIASRPTGEYPTPRELRAELPSIRPYRVLIGHFPAGIKDVLPVPHRIAVMLRDPVQRSLSLLAHLERQKGLSPATVLASEELCARYLVNLQTWWLGWVIGQGRQPVTETTLEQALRNLDDFDFVGLTERFADSCRLFDSTFGTAVTSVMREENVLRPGGRGYEEFIPAIEPLVEVDRVLYARARARFERDFAARSATAPVRRAA